MALASPHQHGAAAAPPPPSRNINLEGAYLHVLGDLLQSIGVMAGGAAIWYNPEWKIVDLICTLVFSALVLVTTFRMLRDVIDVLMESTPRGINASEVESGLKTVPGVEEVHELHIWALTLGKTMLACHVKINADRCPDAVLTDVLRFCDRRYGIHHATVQVERVSQLQGSQSAPDISTPAAPTLLLQAEAASA